MTREPLQLKLHQWPNTTIPIDLEKACPECKGTGQVDEWNDYKKRKCSHCNGTGVELTENGEAILQLVSEHLVSKLTVTDRR